MTLHGFLPRKEPKREPVVFQDKFTMDDIPIDRKYIKALKRKITHPYPVQVVAIGSMFDVPIPADINEDLAGKITRKKDGMAWLKQRQNLVISSSTSSGKTLLAKLFMIKNLQKGMGIYTAPLKALAEEKYDELSSEFPFLKVGILTGDFHNLKIKNIEEMDVIVTTYERLDSILRNHRSLIERRMGSLVIDEIHNLQTDRGLKIEDLIMKVKKMKNVAVMATSATIGNPAEIAGCLEAGLIESTFRPVPLKKGILHSEEKMIEYENGEIERFNVAKSQSVERIIAHKVLDGNQVMYVRMSRGNAQSFAQNIVRHLKGEFFDKSMSLPLKRKKTDMELALDKCLKHGVAWHHAGIPQVARVYIESMFRAGKIRFICSTTTLAAGINMPSKYVFLDWKRFDPDLGSIPIPVMEALQITGRAGRPQYDNIGYGIFVCRNDNDYDYCFENYYDGQPEKITSPFLKDSKGLYHSIIGNIGTYAITLGEVRDLYKGSFAHYQKPERINKKVNVAIQSIKEFDEPLIENKDGKLILTKLGKEIKRYYVEPSDGMIIEKMTKDFKPPTDIGIVHAIARCSAIPKLRLRGISEYWDAVYTHAKNKLFYRNFNINDEIEWKAFQTAAILIGTGFKDETIYADEHVGMQKLCYTHGLLSGDVQRTVGIGGNFPWMLAFARALARNHERYDLMKQEEIIEIRLRYEISERLVNVARIKWVGKERAKALFEIGYCDIESISDASISDIANIEVGNKKKKIGLSIAAKIVESARIIMTT